MVVCYVPTCSLCIYYLQKASHTSTWPLELSLITTHLRTVCDLSICVCTAALQPEGSDADGVAGLGSEGLPQVQSQGSNEAGPEAEADDDDDDDLGECTVLLCTMAMNMGGLRA